MNRNLKIKVSSIQDFLVLFSCCGIEYINSFVPTVSKLLFILRMLLIGTLVLNNIQSKKRLSSEMKLIGLFCFYIIAISVINKLDILYVLRSLSVPYLTAYYIDLQKSDEKVYNTVCLWKNMLLILVGLDFLTMLLFPSGLYNTEIYSLNWFLGYKTARFPFVLLLCILEEIVARRKNKFLQADIVYLLSAIVMLKSMATAALLSYCCAICTIISSRQQHKGEGWKQKVIGGVLDYRLIIPAYGVITFITVVANSSPIMVDFLETIGKDPTLTTRTFIWTNAIKLIKSNLLLGYGYLNADQYRKLLGSVFFSSPHNMVLSLLMIGGLVSAVMYLLIIVNVWKKSKVNQIGFICTIGMLTMLFVGITSSSMIFTLSGFVIFVLAEHGELIV